MLKNPLVDYYDRPSRSWFRQQIYDIKNHPDRFSSLTDEVHLGHLMEFYINYHTILEVIFNDSNFHLSLINSLTPPIIVFELINFLNCFLVINFNFMFIIIVITFISQFNSHLNYYYYFYYY